MKNSSWLLFGFPINLKKSGESAVVVGLSGEAIYHPASGENVAVQEGAVLAASGTLSLGPETKVTLFYDGQRHTLDTEGRHDLGEVLQSGSGSVSLKKGFAKKFEEELMMAFVTSGPTAPSSPTSSGPTSNEDDKDDPIGWGARSIVLISPVDTTVSSEIVLFIWTERGGSSEAAYNFSLFRDGSDTPIMQAAIQKKQLLLDLSAFSPTEGEKFYWTISSGDKKSEKASFTFSEEGNESASTLREVRSEKVYQEANKTEQLLMEAVALKGAGLSQQAFQKLGEAASRTPGNRLVEGMTRNFVKQEK